MLKFFKKRWYFFLIIFLIVGGFSYQKQTTLAKAEKQKTYTVIRKTLTDSLSLSGKIDAEEKQTLRFQSSGKMIWVGVKEGDYVKKYQGIASLDQREVQKNLQKYLNTFKDYRWTLDQTREDNKNEILGGLTQELRDKAQRLVDQSQFDLDSSVLNVEIQQLALENSYLYTPIEGIVIHVAVPYAGSNVTPAQAEFDIVNPKTIFFDATADQTDVTKLIQGKKGSIVLDPFPDENIIGTINYISFIPKDGETGTVYEIKIGINVDNSSYKYRAGMTGDANFIIRQRNDVVAIPSNYIKTEKGKQYVWKLENQKKVKIYIKTGIEIDSDTEIISGLNKGDVIYD